MLVVSNGLSEVIFLLMKIAPIQLSYNVWSLIESQSGKPGVVVHVPNIKDKHVEHESHL